MPAWHYGSAEHGVIADGREHGPMSWPPIYPGPPSGEGCAR